MIYPRIFASKAKRSISKLGVSSGVVCIMCYHVDREDLQNVRSVCFSLTGNGMHCFLKTYRGVSCSVSFAFIPLATIHSSAYKRNCFFYI